jgi:hypothetical protein
LLVEDDERGGRPKSTRTEVNIVAVADLVKNYRRIASRMITESSNIPKPVVLRILKEDFCRRYFFFLHDNAPAHKATGVCKCLSPPKNVTTLYYSPYSPDLPPPDYFLFPKLKTKLKGLHFADDAEIQVAIRDELKKVQKVKFSAAFQKMYDRAKAYIYMPMELILN